MGLISDVLNFACDCVFFAGNVITEIAISVSDYVQKTSTIVSEQVKVRWKIHKELHEINLECQDLRRKWLRDGKLPARDNDRFRELNQEREQLKRDLWKVKEYETISKISDNPNSVHSSIITPEKIHILQFHIGQTVNGKKCPRCERDMILQFPRGKEQININQIFWGCTGWYSNGKCKYTMPYHHTDQQLFCPEEIPEFEIDSAEFAYIYSNKQVQNGVAKRMKGHVRQETENYICPVHGEKLIVREKKNFISALDQFFLGCPMWSPNDTSSCNYMVKIKSPAQLSSALRDFECTGIL